VLVMMSVCSGAEELVPEREASGLAREDSHADAPGATGSSTYEAGDRPSCPD